MLDPRTIKLLKKQCKMGFDCVIGNPPYVRSKNISNESKVFLRKWKTSAAGNVDLYIPFFEIGLKMLNSNGVLGLITPNGYLQSVNGRMLRTYLADCNYPVEIIDFRDVQIFKNVTSYTCITIIDKKVFDTTINYVRLNEKEALSQHSYSKYHMALFPKGSPWRMREEKIDIIIDKLETSGTPLAKWKIRNGLATLKNDLYFFVPTGEDENYFYRSYNGKEYKIEKEICIKVAKPNVIKNEQELAQKTEIAIFPYIRNKNTFSIIEEDTLIKVFPNTYTLFCDFKSELEQRDKGHGNYPAWYAYGRTQGMNNFGIKLLIPYIAESAVAVLSLDNSLLFYCGYALISDDERELRILKCFTESDAFWYYIFHTSKPYAKGYMAFAKNYIVKFSIPELSEEEKEYLLSQPEKIEMNEWIWAKYNISKQDIPPTP